MTFRHAFAPRLQGITQFAAGRYDRTITELERDKTWFPPNPYLCEVCRLAEAAHDPRLWDKEKS